MRLLSALVGVSLFAFTAAYAADPHFGQTAFSTPDGTAAQTVFTPDTAAIVLHAQVEDMPAGTKLSAAWIAVKTSVAAPNYKIDSVDSTIDDAVTEDEQSFTLSKPDAGWPEGDYRVDLSINGKVAASPTFQVSK